jgi:hypothetical protein
MLKKELPETWKLAISKKIEKKLFSKVPQHHKKNMRQIRELVFHPPLHPMQPKSRVSVSLYNLWESYCNYGKVSAYVFHRAYMLRNRFFAVVRYLSFLAWDTWARFELYSLLK